MQAGGTVGNVIVLSLVSVKAFLIDFLEKQTSKHRPAVFCHARATLKLVLSAQLLAGDCQ